MRPANQVLIFLAVSLGLLSITDRCLAQARRDSSGATILDSVPERTNIYPANADTEQDIAAALSLATKEKKRVLLVFGANWCYDCHVLDHALHDGDAGKIVREKYLLVHVDIGEGDKNPELVKLYKIPLDKGVPAVAILDAAGKLLYSSGEGEFEAARRMMKQDLVAFLQHWREPDR
jgi:thiol:disulfide interchange protein